MPVRSVLLAAALAFSGAGLAQAQSPWPAPPQASAPSPWPNSNGAQQQQPSGAQSPWPNSGGTPAAAPAAASPFPAAGTTSTPFPAPGAGPSPFGAPRQQPPAVCNDFVEIRSSAEKGALAIRAATQRKAPPPELCPLFRSYNASEGKMLKFMTTNKTVCGVPDQVITQVKTSFAKTAQITKQVCNPQAAAGGPGKPKPPSLGDALGVSAIPTENNTKTGRGTFDTLSGNNPLAR